MIRRVRKSEIKKLKSLCKKNNRWAKYFTSHNLWLERAIEDMESNNRVVFGVFEIKGEGDFPIGNLIGCLFLKKSNFDNSIEFKNLIPPYFENNISPLQMGKTSSLIDKGIKFCEVRGVEKIEIEFPQEEHNFISLFLTKGFKIAALRERYSPGNLLCTLERTMGDTYQGDPFDSIKLSKWFLKSYLSCEIISSSQKNEKILHYNFSLIPPMKIFDRIGLRDNDFTQKGQLWVLEDDDNYYDLYERLKDFKKGSIQIVLNLTNSFNLEHKNKIQDKGVTCFERNEIIKIAGGINSSLSLPISLEKIGGVITVLEETTIKKYSKKKSLTYFLLSGLHLGLTLDYVGEYPLILVLYCPNWKKYETGIIGYAEINKIERPRFEKLLRQNLPVDSALSDEDLKFYQTYSENEKVAKLTCGRVQLFQKPIPILADNSLVMESTANYINNELGNKFNNSSYIDSLSCKNIIDKMKSNIKVQNKVDIENNIKIDDLPIVGILTAIKEEYIAVRYHLKDVKESIIDDTHYETGIFKYDEKAIAKVVIRECGQRNDNAAIQTERIIQHFTPKVLLFVGIAGSRKVNDFQIGDVIFPSKIYSYEGGKSEEHMFSSRPESEYSSYELLEIAKTERRKSDWLKLLNNPNQNIKADIGVIASGEQIIEHYDSLIGKVLTKYYNDTSAVEMEGFGFAKAATKRGRNTGGISIAIIRGISDVIKNIEINPDIKVYKDNRPKQNKVMASESAAAFAYWLLIKFLK